MKEKERDMEEKKQEKGKNEFHMKSKRERVNLIEFVNEFNQ